MSAKSKISTESQLVALEWKVVDATSVKAKIKGNEDDYEGYKLKSGNNRPKYGIKHKDRSGIVARFDTAVHCKNFCEEVGIEARSGVISAATREQSGELGKSLIARLKAIGLTDIKSSYSTSECKYGMLHVDIAAGRQSSIAINWPDTKVDTCGILMDLLLMANKYTITDRARIYSYWSVTTGVRHRYVKSKEVIGKYVRISMPYDVATDTAARYDRVVAQTLEVLKLIDAMPK